ncbi:hypothetical protein EV363DRAFT_1171517, partial [Boletus edulis]
EKKKLRTYFYLIHVRGIDVHIDKALLWSPGRSSHFWNIQTPPNSKKTSAISQAGCDSIALSDKRLEDLIGQNETPTNQHTNTLLIWGGCPRELLTSQAMSGIEFPIPHVVRHLRDKWMEGISFCHYQCYRKSKISRMVSVGIRRARRVSWTMHALDSATLPETPFKL